MQISIFSAPTLQRYTENILCSGLRKCGHDVDSVVSPITGSISNTTFDKAQGIIMQIHGAPAARAADKEIVHSLIKLTQHVPSILLLHRPDEIKDAFPELQDILSQLPDFSGSDCM